MDFDRDDVNPLRDATDEVFDLTQNLRALREHLLKQSNSTSININAGGAAVWMAVTACLCTTLLTVIAWIWAMFEFSDIRDTEKLHKAYIDKLRQDQKEQSK